MHFENLPEWQVHGKRGVVGGNSSKGGLRDGRGAVQPPPEVVAPLLRLESTLVQL